MSEILFWCTVTLFLYTYLGYPLVSWMLSNHRDGRRRGSGRLPETVTVIVAAHNEEGAISSRLTNLEELAPSSMRMEVIVASDGSTDRTGEIVATWSDPRVRLLALPRGGRALAHNRAAASASGEILVFTDADTRFHRRFFENIVRPFSDPQVGCVVGRLVYAAVRGTVSDDTATYWKGETLLRRWESDAGLLAVGSGCAMAVRRSLYCNLQPDEDADTALPLEVLFRRYRVIFAPEAVAFDVPPAGPRDEVLARARMTVLGLTAILRRRALLNPFRFPRVAFTLISHRILRYLTPAFALGALLSSGVLLGGPFYRLAFMAQILFYACALGGWAARARGPAMPILRLPLSFCVWNIGFAVGVVRTLRGKRVTAYASV